MLAAAAVEGIFSPGYRGSIFRTVPFSIAVV